MRKGYSRFQIVRQLKEKEIDNIILVKPSPLTYQLPITFDVNNILYRKQWLHLKDNQKPLIHHLEVNIADGCNLNCKGCLHFSNLYNRNDFPDLDDLLKAIECVSQNCEIFQFRILGGEPLLNPEIENFLIKLRMILPNSDIAVISNGILIPRMNTSLFCKMKENYVGFNLTLYKPTLKMKDAIYNTLKMNEVAFGSHEAQTDKFEKFLMENPNAIDRRTYEKCVPRGIFVIKDNCLYKCPMEAYIGKYCSTYNVHFPEPCGINVFKIRDRWSEVIDELYMKPRELCQYCSDESELYEWSNGKPEKEDWLI